MAEKKDNNSKATVKPAAAKPAAKTAPAAKPAAAKPAPKTAAEQAKAIAAKPNVKVKPTIGASVSASPKAKVTAAKPAATKSAAEQAKAIAAKPNVKANPVIKAKPAPKPEPKPAPKPEPAAAKPAPKTAAEKAKAIAAKPVTKSKPVKKVRTAEQTKKSFASALVADKKRLLIISAVAAVLIFALILGIVLGVNSCGASNEIYANPYSAVTLVGTSSKMNGTVDRVKPVSEVKDESEAFNSSATGSIFANGAQRYPTYGSTLRHVIGTGAEQVAARNAIIGEASYLCAWGTSGSNNGGTQTPDKYTKIDKDGYLYQLSNGEWIHSLVKTAGGYGTQWRQLYEHSAAKGMYLEGYTRNGVTYGVSDDAPRVIKSVTQRPRGYNSYGITGLYAPAGEVIKVEISGDDMRATGGVVFHIGQALYNGQANNIWAGKNQMQRLPHVLNTLTINTSTAEYDEERDMYTGYIGSFIGGPIYMRNASATFTATISGGVEYLHFILGYTTEEEFNRLKTTSAVQYFDLEVWNYGVLHSGPRYYAEAFSYNDLYKAAVLWEKISNVTTYYPYGSQQGIVFLYDPFVAAGAAVAFPGRSSVNCPASWMTSSLNYDAIVSSGSWGNLHEYHHNFQNYGVGDRGEVTNNALTLVSYSLFTNISAARGLTSYGSQGLGGWNSYTSATWTLQRCNDGQISSTNGLAVYATLLHNFGQEAFIKSRGVSNAAYFNRFAENTHQDFGYYQSLVSSYAVNSTPANTEYPTFVPVSSVYQTGRTYMYDNEKREINTMQPYVIPYGKSFTVDLNPYKVNSAGQYESGSVVIGNGFKYTIEGFNADSANGTFEKVSDGVYRFTPNEQMRSGKIYVTLNITTENGETTYKGHKLDQVDLILEFQQSHETNKTTLERTTYKYSADKMYTDAQEAYENNFGGYESVIMKADHSNPTQNANTDIWYYPASYKTDPKYSALYETHPEYFVEPNQIEVIEGKLYAEDKGKYRIYLRGRLNCALYYSIDGKTYTLGATIKDKTVPTNSHLFRNVENAYVDLDLEEKSWVYLREVLIVQATPAVSYIGVGMKAWTEPQYTMVEKYYDRNGKELTSADDPNIDPTKTKTVYYDNANKEVSADVVAAAKLTPPTFTDKTQPYINAYRSTYEFTTGGFESDYFYKRAYNYNYTDNKLQNSDQILVSQTNYNKNQSWNYTNFPITNLTDGKTGTYVHTNYTPSESKPLEFVLDMGAAKPVNRMVIYTQNRPNGDWHAAKNFNLYGSLDGEEWFSVGQFTNAPRSGVTTTVNFEEQTFRYYKLQVTGATGKYVIIGEIEMWRAFEVLNGNMLTPDDSSLTYKGNWYTVSTSANFGHVYLGRNGATLSFEFTGTRIAILTSKALGRDFDVYIDGTKYGSVQVKEDKADYDVTYLCDRLSSGKHYVEVRCTGEVNIDSVVTFNEPEPEPEE